MISRRNFFKWAVAGAAVGTAAVIVPEIFVPKRTFFLPPKGGWLSKLPFDGLIIQHSNEAEFRLEKISVNAQARPLKATWTIEPMQKLEIEHGFDLEDELIRAFRAEAKRSQHHAVFERITRI